MLLTGTTTGTSVVNTIGRHSAVLPLAACQVRHLDQLKYLAKVMGFEVQVTNIPKVCAAALLTVVVDLHCNVM